MAPPTETFYHRVLRPLLFQLDPELRALVAHMSHAEIDALRRGGHDFRKLYAAFAEARARAGISG